MRGIRIPYMPPVLLYAPAIGVSRRGGRDVGGGEDEDEEGRQKHDNRNQTSLRLSVTL